MAFGKGGCRLGDKLLTVNEVAKMLRVSNMTVYRLVRNKQIHAVKVGKNYRIKQSDVDKYLGRDSG
ncbi:MAG: helix-turn-helix domain-containing protein [Actinomycetota bacterium]|nr:helix-turn-helix domain-containing protein [Actinomycetota bacterium]